MSTDLATAASTTATLVADALVTSAVVAPAVFAGSGFAALLALEYSSSQAYISDMQKYIALAENTKLDVTPTAADYLLANRLGVFDMSDPHDLEFVTLIAKGRAIERAMKEAKKQSSVMDIDPDTGKPSIESFPVADQPRSILSRPNDSRIFAELGQLPGFMPDGLGNSGLLESFPIHDIDRKDLILYKDYDIDHWNVKPSSVKDAPEVYQCGKFGKIYKDPDQKVDNKEIWWSKDTANHGGASQGLLPSAYKLFIKTKTEFKWIGDADENGDVIKGKHKGESGKEININDCNKVK